MSAYDCAFTAGKTFPEEGTMRIAKIYAHQVSQLGPLSLLWPTAIATSHFPIPAKGAFTCQHALVASSTVTPNDHEGTKNINSRSESCSRYHASSGQVPMKRSLGRAAASE